MSGSESPGDMSDITSKRIHKREAYRIQQEEKRQKIKHARVEAPAEDEVKLPKVSMILYHMFFSVLTSPL